LENRVYFPAFRLPAGYELKSAHGLKTGLEPYPPVEFLKYWIDLYTQTRNDSLILILGYEWPDKTVSLVLGKSNSASHPVTTAGEYTLDYETGKKSATISDIYIEPG
jgi:hypothetical protein